MATGSNTITVSLDTDKIAQAVSQWLSNHVTVALGTHYGPDGMTFSITDDNGNVVSNITFALDDFLRFEATVNDE